MAAEARQLSPAAGSSWLAATAVAAALAMIATFGYAGGYIIGVGLLFAGPPYALVMLYLRWRRRHSYTITVIGDGERNAASEFATFTQAGLLLSRWVLAACLGVLGTVGVLNLALDPKVGATPAWLLTLLFCGAFAFVPIPYFGLLAITLSLRNALNRQQVAGEVYALGNHAGAWRRIASSRRLGVVVNGAYVIAVAASGFWALTGHGLPVPYPLV